MDLSLLSLLGIAVGLAMDAFAVSIAAGLAVNAVTPRHVFRIGFHFGLFQFIMPVLGWLAGGQLAAYFGDYDRWVAFALLAYVGGRMLWEARGEKKAENGRDPTRGLMLVTLSIATSLDALAVGVSMAFWAFGVDSRRGDRDCHRRAVGHRHHLRRPIGPRWEHWAEAGGGIVLILIGLKVLFLGYAGPGATPNSCRRTDFNPFAPKSSLLHSSAKPPSRGAAWPTSARKRNKYAY